MLGAADALACEGDSCFLPAAVASAAAPTPSGPPDGQGTEAGPSQEAAVSR